MTAHTIRRLTAVTSLLGGVALLCASSLSAQESRQKEIRLDFASVQSVAGSTQLSVGFPGTVAFGIYMNKNIAIEPQLSFASFSGGGSSISLLNAGLFVPYYLGGDFGRTGLFVSPGFMYGKVGGDLAADGALDLGVDFGFKKKVRDMVSMRLAATLRTGDSYKDVNGDSKLAFGASFGIGYHWK